MCRALPLGRISIGELYAMQAGGRRLWRIALMHYELGDEAADILTEVLPPTKCSEARLSESTASCNLLPGACLRKALTEILVTAALWRDHSGQRKTPTSL